MRDAPVSGSWGDVLGEGRLPRFVLICLGVWLFAADSLVTATIMPSVGHALGGYAWFGWATAGYLLGAVVAGASSGLLAQRFGLRRATAAAAALYSTGCVLSAWAPDMASFLAGRIIQGVAGGWVSGFCSVAIGLMFPDRLLARVYASATAVWGIATLIGPMVGGLFADAGASGWRWVFWFFAAQGLAVAAAAVILLPRGERGDAATRVPWRQLALVLAGVGVIGFADRAGQAWMTAVLAAAGITVLIVTVRIDARATTRMLPANAGRLSSTTGAVYAAMFLLNAAGMAFSVYGPVILQTLKGYSALSAGYIVAIEALSWTVCGLMISHLTGPWPRRLMRLGAVCIALGIALSALAFPTANLPGVLASGLIMGGGFGLSWAFMAQRLMTSVPEAERAIASAGMFAVRLTGSAAGAAAAAAVANLVGMSLTPDAASAGAAGLWVYVAMTPVALLAIPAVWRLSAPSSDPSGPPQ